jgi:GNAT superfamily N-acetyltransferase
METIINISLATIEDAAAILDLQRCAYQSEAAIYDDYTLPPLLETLDELRGQFASKKFLKVVHQGEIVGSVRAIQTEEPDAACRVERLVVHPDHRGRGIGTALLRRIEEVHPDARRFELFTGHKSLKNLRLYEGIGYRRMREERANDKVTLVFLEKRRP